MTGQRLYIREWRKHRRLKQAALAHDAGLSRSVVSAIESGKQEYRQSHLEALACALGVPAGVLLLFGPDDTPMA